MASPASGTTGRILAQKNGEIWSAPAPLICFLTPQHSSHVLSHQGQMWNSAVVNFSEVGVFQQTYLGFGFRLDSPLLLALLHFTAPILPLQPPRCAAVRVRFQLLRMSPADPPWNQPTLFCQELETLPRSHTELRSFIKSPGVTVPSTSGGSAK